MIRNLILTLATSCLLLVAVPSYGKIRVGVTSFPPFYTVDASGKAGGILLEIMLRTLESAGIEYEVEVFPPKRLYTNLGMGKTDLFLGLQGSPIYHDHVIYSEKHITYLSLRVYANADTPLPASKEELSGHVLGTIRGYSYGGFIRYIKDPRNNIIEKPMLDHMSSFLMLKNKRIEYLLNYKHPSDQVLSSLYYPGLKFTEFMNANVHFIVSKATPEAVLLMKTLETTYQRLKEAGEFATIRSDDTAN